ncbi:MAG TPA: DUF2283 domain-containing protein [Armatimonadota bacterium]|nr:DUF2283 domain-containing protein [Armatimonadota bacterium]
MRIVYDTEADLLYLRLDERQQEVVNRQVTDNVVFDVGEDDKIVGIEILDASMHLNLDALLPVHYGTQATRAA